MTEEQRQQRARFVREEPVMWLFLLYAAAFLGCAVASDMLQLVGGGPAPDRLRGYLLPFVIVLPMWLGFWGWARRMAARPRGESGADQSAGPLERR